MGPDGSVVPTGSDASPSPFDQQLALARAEVEQLQRAMRHRSVIEQAKGVLMGWLGVDAEAAFGLLVGYSQRTGRTLATAATSLMRFAVERERGVTPPLPTDLQLFAELAEERFDAHLRRAAVAGAPDLDRMLEEVRDAVGAPVPAALLVAAMEPDGALRILASQGYAPATMTGWHRVPPDADVPMAFVAATGQAVFATDRRERDERFPGARGIPGTGEALACMPVELAGLRLGVMGMTWNAPHAIEPDQRRDLLELADRCARPLAEHLLSRDALADALPRLITEPGRSRWFHAAIEELPVPVLLLQPSLDADGSLVDLELVQPNGEAVARLTEHVRPTSRRVSEITPWLPRSPLWPLLVATLQDGTTRRLEHLDLPLDEQGRRELRAIDIRVSRVGSILLVAWRAMVPRPPGASALPEQGTSSLPDQRSPSR
jgi:hypothetical protein